jgi:hypothetical protein
MDTSDVASNAAAAGILSGIILTAIIVSIALAVFFVWLFWRIFSRTGMNGALGLLCLVPYVGWLICLLVLAFSRWPIEDALGGSGGMYAGSPFAPPPPPAAPPPPPASPPGSSVMPT